MKNKPQLYSGLHAVEALLQHRPHDVLELFVLDSREHSDQRRQALIQQARQQGIAVQHSGKVSLDKMAGSQHQGVVARARPRLPGEESQLLALVDRVLQSGEPLYVLVLDGVTDPHNLGACLRTADAAGVHAVVVPRRNACGLTPVVCRTAVGAAETVPYFEVANLSRVLEDFKKEGIWVVGTGRAENSVKLTELSPLEAMAIVMGSEGTGMRRLTTEKCDYLVEIPMRGTVESLNVSVATAVVLYHLVTL